MKKLLVIAVLIGTLSAFAQEKPQRPEGPPQGRGPGMGQ